MILTISIILAVLAMVGYTYGTLTDEDYKYEPWSNIILSSASFGAIIFVMTYGICYVFCYLFGIK